MSTGENIRLIARTPLSSAKVVASWILVRPTTFVEIDHEIISRIVFLLSYDSRRVVVSYKVHKELVNGLVKPSLGKSVVT